MPQEITLEKLGREINDKCTAFDRESTAFGCLGQIDYCPDCHEKLTFGMKSCLSCGWNVGEIPIPFASEESSSFGTLSEFMDN
jgi:hypothetical protein